VAENAKLSCDHSPGARVMHEIILATIVLTSQRFMHEHFVTIPTLSCMNRTASGGSSVYFQYVKDVPCTMYVLWIIYDMRLQE
jgi:hypothetical protein